MSADAWAVWLAIRRKGHVNANLAQLTQEANFAPHGQRTQKPQRDRTVKALAELEDLGYIGRNGGSYTILESIEGRTA